MFIFFTRFSESQKLGCGVAGLFRLNVPHELQSSCWLGLLSAEGLNGLEDPVPWLSGGCFGSSMTVGRTGQPYRASCFSQSNWSTREWGGSYHVFYELLSLVTYYPFCCSLLSPSTNLETGWEFITEVSECRKVGEIGSP